MTNYEYGIGHRETFASGGSHRSQMTKLEAEQWLQGWREDHGADYPFFIVRRPLGQWERISNGDLAD